jgi:protein phosphatase
LSILDSDGDHKVLEKGLTDTMKIHSVSHQGVGREANEDCYIVRQFDHGSVLLAVADGMGGHAAGERASQIATAILDGFDPDSAAIEEHLAELVQAAKSKVSKISAEDPALEGMGTTLTVAFVKDGLVHWIHVGDSRFYLFREGMLAQVTEDHSVPGLLLREGEITKEEARVHPLRNMIYSFIGREDLEADMGSFEVSQNDLILLSTDGLHDTLPEQMMESILRSPARLKDKLDNLSQAAINAGSRDDITVVAVET